MLDIIFRVEEEARYIINNKSTLRQTAKIFGVSKSTVHIDMHKKLQSINNQLFEEVSKVLDNNLAERHIRGGEATRKKYYLNSL